MMDLVCVDPTRIDEIWPHAKHLIKAAIDATELSDFRDIERAVLDGDQLLWLAWDGHAIMAAATTQLLKGVCVLTACSGHHRERWLPLFAQIEKYAQNEGCSTMRLYGRKGWERVLQDYRIEHVVLEKRLN
jgi:hypothetical protein